MRFQLLGPLEVADDGASVAVGRGKRRCLLALLLLHANEVVSAERLIDELRGERPPPTAAKSRHVYVSQLRKELAHNGDVLETRGNGYVMRIGLVTAVRRRDASESETGIRWLYRVVFHEALHLAQCRQRETPIEHRSRSPRRKKTTTR
jgi:DNA-binding SARP family transcriptional activator